MTGFCRLLHAEWTKFRTVPGWVAGMVAAALMVVLVAVLAGIGGDPEGSPPVPIGPGGEPVTDSFFFVHRPLIGDGSIVVSVSALRSRIPADPAHLEPGVVPWAKAGLLIRASTRPGAPYAAIMVTGSHGVRMQHDYVHDRPGPVPAASVRWLRLDRSGGAITGSASADGTHWITVGTTRLPGLGPAADGGMFVASPPAVDGRGTRGSVSTAVFAGPRIEGRWAGADWTGTQLGEGDPGFAGYPGTTSGSVTGIGRSYTVTGAGDLAPAVRETLPTAGTLQDILTGTFPALVTVAVIGALGITTEHRTNLLRSTLAAAPGRGRVLLAKATVLGGVAFAAGLAGTAVAAPLSLRLAQAHGVYVFPATARTEARVVLGTAALLATASILALAVGTVVRHSAAAVSTVVGTVVLPYLLIANPFLPAGAAGWLARVTPAAAFAVQQTLVPYEQVSTVSTPYDGYYPLAPWAGLAVLAGYAAGSLAAAAVLLHRRDA